MFTGKTIPTSLKYPVAALLLFCTTMAHSADVVLDFSTTSSQSGGWSYGSLATLNGAFALDTAKMSMSNNQMQGWTSDASSIFPFVEVNTTNHDVIDGGTTYLPGLIAMHPSPTGIYSAVQWTAPTSGMYSIAATFADVPPSYFPATVDLHILLNGSSIFDSNLSGNQLSQSFNKNVSLTAGQSITFAVGFGSNQNYYYDHTSLSAQINPISASVTPVPEPSTFALMLIGGAVVARKNRKLSAKPVA